MREHVAVKRWSERREDEPTKGSPLPGTFYVAHCIQCRCGEVFVSRHALTSKSLLRVHRAQQLADKKARAGNITGSKLRESRAPLTSMRSSPTKAHQPYER